MTKRFVQRCEKIALYFDVIQQHKKDFMDCGGGGGAGGGGPGPGEDSPASGLN